MAIDKVVSIHPITAVRRVPASCDPRILAVHERLVAAREGTRRFVHQTATDQNWGWHEIAAEADQLVDQAQLLVEALR